MFRCLQCRFFMIWLMVCYTSVPTSSDQGYRDETKDNVIYLIVAIVGVFLITIIVVVVLSWYQTKDPPPSRRSRTDPTQFAEQMHSRRNNAYDVQKIGYANENVRDLWWEIPVNNLKIYRDQVLGSGQFGVILLGHILKDGNETKCAVKMLKGNATEAEKRSLKKELRNMSGMDPHPNIVNLIGAQTVYDNLLVVVEFCAYGSLLDYLRKHRSQVSSIDQRKSGTTIDYVTRLTFAFDIANGMNYLATKQFVHRDLAARNVLLDANLRGKVADFGRTRDINEMFKGFESMRGLNEPIPTRWMPVETLMYQKFTSKSDVWSYGVLLWEIESGGVRPYDNQRTYREILDKVVHQGYRLEQPYNCPEVLYRVMTECWRIQPDDRPTFGQLAGTLGSLLKENIPPTR